MEDQKDDRVHYQALAETGDPKYSIDLDRECLINRVSGKPIPADEPVMIFRAQDENLPDTIADYFTACSLSPPELATPEMRRQELEHRLAIAKRLVDVCAWQLENHLRVKTPDTVLDEKWG